MWKPALGIAAVLVVVAMSGCAASVESRPAKSAAPVATSAPSAAPVALAPDAETTTAAISDEQFIEEFRLRVKDMADTDDAALIAAAKQACELFTAGSVQSEINLIEPSPDQDPELAAAGVQDMRNGALTYWAAAAYCPEFLPG